MYSRLVVAILLTERIILAGLRDIVFTYGFTGLLGTSK